MCYCMLCCVSCFVMIQGCFQERLWNTVGYILRDERARMGAENFEAQMFLNINEIYGT